tara:strand:- start:52 stop:462 length:411 start_codon:yes stop_codon:yes gene_type:complete
MTDLSITAANVLSGAGSLTENGVAGDTITQGKPVYLDTADSEYKLADSDSAAALARVPRGIALNSAADGQPLTIHRKGPLTIGATLTAGVAYYLSDEPGGICPVGDLESGDYTCIIGIAISTTVLDVNIQASGVAL